MKTLEIKTIDPALLEVTRDGELDGSYYDAVYAEKRREALHAAGREALQYLRDVPEKFVDGLWVVIDHVAEESKRV
jgi:hypothetical protein